MKGMVPCWLGLRPVFALDQKKEQQAMRLIYDRGQRIGPFPVGRYIYLWRHGSIDRYVGKGNNGRWSAHLKAAPNDANQRKTRYFMKHGPELSCYLIAEDLESDWVAAQREIAEIDLRGLERDGKGTLLNDRRGSVVPGPRRPVRAQEAGLSGYQQFKALLKRNQLLLVPVAVFRRAGRALNGNPKSPNCAGAMYLDLYPPAGQTITVADMLAKGRALGIKDKAQLGHLAWDLDHGFIEIMSHLSLPKPDQKPEPKPEPELEPPAPSGGKTYHFRVAIPELPDWLVDVKAHGWTEEDVQEQLKDHEQDYPQAAPEPWPGYWMEYANRVKAFETAAYDHLDTETADGVLSTPLVVLADALRRNPGMAAWLPENLKPPLTPPSETPAVAAAPATPAVATAPAMRLIYANGRMVGSPPSGRYIYLWRHGSIDRYVGKGVNRRWSTHLKTNLADANQRKSRYFTKHEAELSCFIIAEDLESDRVTAERVIAEIDQRGLERDGAGTLLNDRRGSIMPGPRLPRHPAEAGMTKYQQWRAMTERNTTLLTVPGVAFRRAGRALNGNPKSPNCAGAMYLDLYPPAGETITVADMLAKGRALGIKDKAQLGHLAWDLEHGFIEIVKPEGGSTTALGGGKTPGAKTHTIRVEIHDTLDWFEDAKAHGWTREQVQEKLEEQAQSHPQAAPEPWPGYWTEYANRVKAWGKAAFARLDPETVDSVLSMPLVVIADMLRRSPEESAAMLPDELKPPLTPPPAPVTATDPVYHSQPEYVAPPAGSHDWQWLVRIIIPIAVILAVYLVGLLAH
jgi:hypothetical protein